MRHFPGSAAISMRSAMDHPGRSSHDHPDGSPADDPYAWGSYPRDQYSDDRNRQDAQAPAWPAPPERGAWPGYPGPPPSPSAMPGNPMPGNPMADWQPTGSWQAHEATGPRPPEM